MIVEKKDFFSNLYGYIKTFLSPNSLTASKSFLHLKVLNLVILQLDRFLHLNSFFQVHISNTFYMINILHSIYLTKSVRIKCLYTNIQCYILVTRKYIYFVLCQRFGLASNTISGVSPLNCPIITSKSLFICGTERRDGVPPPICTAFRTHPSDYSYSFLFHL